MRVITCCTEQDDVMYVDICVCGMTRPWFCNALSGTNVGQKQWAMYCSRCAYYMCNNGLGPNKAITVAWWGLTGCAEDATGP